LESARAYPALLTLDARSPESRRSEFSLMYDRSSPKAGDSEAGRCRVRSKAKKDRPPSSLPRYTRSNLTPPSSSPLALALAKDTPSSSSEV